MDEIEYKLTSNNPILVAHGIAKILETTKNKIKNSSSRNDIANISELKLLYTKCKNENTVVSSTACQALIFLVKNGLLDISSTLSQFIIILGETTNHSSVTAAICNLLTLELKMKDPSCKYTCPFNIKATPQHPLITVLIQKSTAWRDILQQMQLMLNCESELIVNHVELLRPVFMYILCNPSMTLSQSCHQQCWYLLINTQGTMHLQLEILQWLQVNNAVSCINASNIVLELAKMARVQNNHELYIALAPLIIALALDLIMYDSDPRPNINMIYTILNFINNSSINEDDITTGNIMIALLSEILIVIPTSYLADIMKIGRQILTKFGCNQIIAHSLMASILPWMAYVTVLNADALEVGQDLVNKISTNSYHRLNINSKKNQYVDIIRHANQHYQFYTEICDYLYCANDNDLIVWLDKLSKIPKDFLFDYRLILSGMFIQSSNFNIIKLAIELLLQIAQSNKNFAGYVLSLLLHKLTNTRVTSSENSIELTRQLLLILPELAVSKENIPIIIHTLETFVNAGEPLKYLAITLYLKAWIIEPRCHRFLLTVLIDISKNDKTMKGNVTCAKAMKFICQHRPEHGTELVPLLSNILNRCTETVNSAAHAMALQGISALCLSGVADVCSTWRVLSPIMSKEQRPIVIISMCEFFGDIPSNPVLQSEEEFDQLIEEVLTKLWEFSCFETTRNIGIVKAAFKALSAFPINKQKVSVLPLKYKSHLPQYSQQEKFTQSSASGNAEETEEKTSTEVAVVNNYIPGTCWINMLEVIHDPARTIAGDYIIKLIGDELYSFRTGIYMWPRGEPINYKYLPEKSPSRAVGEYLRRYNSDLPANKKKVAIECLRIFSKKYPKALPPIKWNALENAMKISDEAWDYGITMACHQAPISSSAKEFLSKYLIKITAQSNDADDDEITEAEFKKCWHLCTDLEDICRGVMSNALSPFLTSTINYVVNRALVGKENFIIMFDKLMTKYSKSLKDDLVHHDIKTLITNILETLLIKIDVKNKIFPSLVNAILEMSIEQIERMTLPSVWAEITSEKLEKAMAIRAGLVLKKDNEIPLSWMNEIIRVSASMSGTHKCLLENMVKILMHLRHEKSNASWCWDLMCQVQATIVNSTDTSSIDSVILLCDTLFVTIIMVSCNNCLLTSDKSIITSHDVRARLFPHALARIISMPRWKDMAQQIMEWLNFMRTSSLPESYKIAFHNALVSLKKEKCLNDLWTKYFSIRGLINFVK